MPVYLIHPEEMEAFVSPEKLEAFRLKFPPENYPLNRVPKEVLKEFFGTCKAPNNKFQILYETLATQMSGRKIFRLPVPAYFSDEEYDDTREVHEMMIANEHFKNPECKLKEGLPLMSEEDRQTYLKRVGTFQNAGNLLGLLRVMELGIPELKDDLEMQMFAMDRFEQIKQGEGDSGALRTEVSHYAVHKMKVMYDDTVQPFTGFGTLEQPCWLMKSNGCGDFSKGYLDTFDLATDRDPEWVKNYYIKGGVSDFLNHFKSGNYSLIIPSCLNKAKDYEQVGFLKEFGVKISSNSADFSEI